MFMAIIKVTAFNCKKVARYYVRNSTLYSLSEAQDGLAIMIHQRENYTDKSRFKKDFGSDQNIS